MDITQTAVVVGAAYGAVQAVAQFLMLILPKDSPVWRICKQLVAGPARPALAAEAEAAPAAEPK